jgi:crotonobetainyl-CoA:carnitine CoA-transferase CaiB-like acyl-CoA transferase
MERVSGAPPLAGTRVISLAEQYPGPYCTLLLADLGAEVILVERPRGGDPARGPRGSSAFFEALARGKRSLTLDLKHPAGAHVLWQLLARADVLVEGFRPGVLARLGFGAETVLARAPRLVYCSISGYGQDGPYRERAGHDLSYQALAGLVAAAGGDPTAYRPPLAIGDLSSGTFAAFGIVVALLHRERSGAGQRLDVSMTDGLVSWMGTVLEPLLNGREREAWAGPAEPAYGVFRCADGRHLSLSIAHEDHFWRNLCDVLGLPGLGPLGGRERRARAAELRHFLAERLATRSRDEWTELLARANVAAGPVLEPAEVIGDAQLRARGLFVSSKTEAGERSHVAHPLRLSASPPRAPSPAPALGEHTEAILRELGYDSQAIGALRRDGAI